MAQKQGLEKSALASSTKLDINTDDDDLELLLTNKQPKQKEQKKLFDKVYC